MIPGTTPQPGTLGALLRQQLAPQQPKSASAMLSTVPQVVDLSAWYEQHVALLHQFLHHALRAVASTPAKRNSRLVHRLEQAHTDLRRHTLLIAGDAVPTVLSSDGRHVIPFERLAVARAKVQVLTAELVQAGEAVAALRIEGWRPAFDAVSVRQEELAIQFCQEIAGPRGELGSPPDPVRLLEMAQALYEAERDDLAPARRAAS